MPTPSQQRHPASSDWCHVLMMFDLPASPQTLLRLKSIPITETCDSMSQCLTPNSSYFQSLSMWGHGVRNTPAAVFKVRNWEGKAQPGKSSILKIILVLSSPLICPYAYWHWSLMKATMLQTGNIFQLFGTELWDSMPGIHQLFPSHCHSQSMVQLICLT